MGLLSDASAIDGSDGKTRGEMRWADYILPLQRPERADRWMCMLMLMPAASLARRQQEVQGIPGNDASFDTRGRPSEVGYISRAIRSSCPIPQQCRR